MMLDGDFHIVCVLSSVREWCLFGRGGKEKSSPTSA
jgi:hypothetical protein